MKVEVGLNLYSSACNLNKNSKCCSILLNAESLGKIQIMFLLDEDYLQLDGINQFAFMVKKCNDLE